MLSITGISKSYDNNFCLDIPFMALGDAAITAILGPNGAGKSTLLEIIAGIQKADRGTISLDGMTLRAGTSAGLPWRRAVTMVAQKPFLFSGTVSDNIGYGLKVRGVPGTRRRANIRDALARTGLDGYESRPVSELSGGEAQLVALARALVLTPRILLLDEPTAHLDREIAIHLEGIISSLIAKNATTILLATHNQEQAFRLSDSVLSLIGGKIVEAQPENVFKGRVVDRCCGLAAIALKGGITVQAETSLADAVSVAIDPAAILISRQRLESSARNSFSGILTSATSRDNRVQLTVNAGVVFSVLITESSFGEMRLNPGEKLYLTFKTSAVKVF